MAGVISDAEELLAEIHKSITGSGLLIKQLVNY